MKTTCGTCRFRHAFSVGDYGGWLAHRCSHWRYIDISEGDKSCELREELTRSEAKNMASLLSMSFAEWVYLQRKTLVASGKTP